MPDRPLGRPVPALGHLEATIVDFDDATTSERTPLLRHAISVLPRMACVDGRSCRITGRIAVLPGVDGTNILPDS